MTSPSPSAFTFKSIPEWGWIAIAAAAAGAYFIMSKKKSPATTTVGANSMPVGTSAYTTVGAMPVTTDAGVTSILTNAQWAIAAEKDLIQKGQDPKKSADAIKAYVTNQTLTTDQNTLVDQALKDIGPLPNISSGSNSTKLDMLHNAPSGNLVGQFITGFANMLGLGDPGNPIGTIVDPIINDIADQGPIGGVWKAFNDLLGLNYDVGVTGANVDTPIGNVSLGGELSNNGFSLNANAPGGVGVNLGLSPNGTASYIGSYTVQPGDTLESISQTLYGSVGGARAIYSANLSFLPDPSNLTPGTVLQIPSPNNNA